MAAIPVVQEELPASEDATFIHTGFFRQQNETLPSPGEVRQRAIQNGIHVSPDCPSPPPVSFPELGLIVKWGTDITIAEGQCIWFMRKHLTNEVPSPEIYGWRRERDTTFLYMELVQGDTLAERWPDLDESDRISVCEQLRQTITCWRRMTRTSRTGSLSQIGGQDIRDYMFQDGGAYPAGPFSSISAFHDSFAQLALRVAPACANLRQDVKYLTGLTDDTPLVFTHGDLDQTNVLISKPDDGPARIVAVIDWHQSGWYPEPWEFLKMEGVANPESDWRDYIPKILDPANHGYFVAFSYVRMAVI